MIWSWTSGGYSCEVSEMVSCMAATIACQKRKTSAALASFDSRHVSAFNAGLVLVSPVLGLQKNRDWTGPGLDLDRKFQGLEKTVTVVQSSVFQHSKISKTN